MEPTASPTTGVDVFDRGEGQQSLRRTALLYMDDDVAALLVPFLDGVYYESIATTPYDWPECVSKARLRAVLDDLFYSFSLVLSIAAEPEESHLHGDDLRTALAAGTELVPALRRAIETFERVLGPPPDGQARRIGPGARGAELLEQVGRLMVQTVPVKGRLP